MKAFPSLLQIVSDIDLYNVAKVNKSQLVKANHVKRFGIGGAV